MKVRALFPLAAAAGFWLAEPAIAQQPAPLPASVANPNQTLADSVAAKLRETNVAAGADIAIVVQDGNVTLTGTVKDASQKDRIIREVRGVTGVIVIRDGLKAAANGLVQVQDTGYAPVAPYPLAPQGGPPMGGAGPIVEPAPLGVPGQFSPEMGAPNLPPYAWPTYAPYNNVSRVAYPTCVPVQRVPVHRAVLPVPEGSARLAEGDAGMGRRVLVPRPQLRPAGLLARPVLVIGIVGSEQWPAGSGQWAVSAVRCSLLFWSLATDYWSL